MNNDLLNKITAWEPRAVWTEGGDGMFTVPADGFHDLAGHLRADGFDFLRSLTGMDWGEAGSAWFIILKRPRRARTSCCGR